MTPEVIQLINRSLLDAIKMSKMSGILADTVASTGGKHGICRCEKEAVRLAWPAKTSRKAIGSWLPGEEG